MCTPPKSRSPSVFLGAKTNMADRDDGGHSSAIPEITVSVIMYSDKLTWHTSLPPNSENRPPSALCMFPDISPIEDPPIPALSAIIIIVIIIIMPPLSAAVSN
ncbi:hypothetical protein BZA77DRAFT_291507 [Pyronema omphalodes]|nr:hypothetical protein BZA77DRAFT_291507 [Pyronema omphalodes]